MPEVFEALCASAGENVQEFNAHDISNTPWAIAKTGTHMLEVFAGLSVRRRAMSCFWLALPAAHALRELKISEFDVPKERVLLTQLENSR